MCSVNILFTVVEVAAPRDGWVEPVGWVSVKQCFNTSANKKSLFYNECFCTYYSIIFYRVRANYSSYVTKAKPQELIDKWCQDVRSVEKSKREILFGEEHGAEHWGCKPAARLGNTCRAVSLPGACSRGSCLLQACQHSHSARKEILFM